MVGSPSEGGLGVKVARVYVSSTIADLTEERQAVLDWLRLARHQAVDSYLPYSSTVRDSCLDDVAACDLYALILGHRYGFQPPQDNPEGLSITQLEFRRAGDCGIPRVALLRTSIPDVSLSDLADPRRLALVSAFRDEVARQVRPAQFRDLQGLIQGLSTGIQGQLEKLAKRDEGQAAPVTAGRVLRLAPRPVFLAGRDELRQRRADLLRRGEPTGYSQTVATARTLAFEDLQQAAPCASGLLRLLAFCAPEAIPLRLLLQPRAELAGRLAPEAVRQGAARRTRRFAAFPLTGAQRRVMVLEPAQPAGLHGRAGRA